MTTPLATALILLAIAARVAAAQDSTLVQDTTSAAPVDTAAPTLIRRAVTVHLVFTGDINLGTITIDSGVPPDSGVAFFSQVDSLLKGDLVVGNFEGVLADSGESLKCGPPEHPDTASADSTLRPRHRKRPLPKPKPHPNCYAFGTPSWLAPRLIEAGFTHLNQANNHANDFGSAALARTELVFDSLGLRHYGPLEQISIDTVRQGDSATVVGLLGFTTYPFAYNLLDLERSAAVVDSVKRLVDILIVTFHGGTEGAGAIHTGRGPEFLVGEPRGDLRKWARRVLLAGADAVVGHGPHVLRGVEFYAGKPIFYSLGNFATYRGFNLEGPMGLTAVLQLQLDGDGVFRSARMIPLRQVPQAGPRPDSTRAALRLLRRVTKQDFGKLGATIGADGEITPP